MQMRHIITGFLFVSINTHAGNLINGQWYPANCGLLNTAPVFDTSSVDAYNDSVKAVMAWQQQAQEYHNCLAKEANADNEIIAKTANAAQNQFLDQTSKIKAQAEAAKNQMEGSSQ